MNGQVRMWLRRNILIIGCLTILVVLGCRGPEQSVSMKIRKQLVPGVPQQPCRGSSAWVTVLKINVIEQEALIEVRDATSGEIHRGWVTVGNAIDFAPSLFGQKGAILVETKGAGVTIDFYHAK